jgi:hypothetical protein
VAPPEPGAGPEGWGAAPGSAYALAMDQKTCPQCGNTYARPSGISQAQWEGRKFCSQKCSKAANGPAWIESMRPWQSTTIRCAGTTAGGQACSEFEIEGLEYCLHHVPEDLLEEAEEITGIRRCRTAGCTFYAVDGTEPATCKNHGANAGSVTSREAAKRVIQREVDAKFREIMAEDNAAARILNPPPIANPLEYMLRLGAELEEFRQMMRDKMLGLKEDEWRYKGREAEMTRAEILLYERACERMMAWSKVVHTMGIEKTLARIEERKVQVMERGLTAALQGSGASLPVQEQARRILRREMEKASLN